MLNLAPEPKKLRWTVIMEPTNSQGHVNFRLGENWHDPSSCQFSPRRKLTWPRTMSIFAQAKIDMASHHVNFRPGENWHALASCQFSPGRKLTCPLDVNVYPWRHMQVWKKNKIVPKRMN